MVDKFFIFEQKKALTKDFIEKAFQTFHHQRILIIGDVMIDSYLWGKVDRISPEAPVPIVTGIRKEKRLGGAANVALNIAALGAKPIICSVTGDDDDALIITHLMEKSAIDASGLVADKGRPTTVKTRIISANQHLMRIDEEVSTAVDIATEQKMYAFVENSIVIKGVDAIIFEDYDKGCLTPSFIQKVIAKAQTASIPVLVDPKKRNYNSYQGATLFKPNFKEFCEGVKADIGKTDFATIYSFAEEFRSIMNFDCLMVTMAENGILVCTKDGCTRSEVVDKIDIADVSGAGDTVISVVACCMAAGISPVDVAILANLAGGQVCEKPGVVPVDKHALLKRYETLFC